MSNTRATFWLLFYAHKGMHHVRINFINKFHITRQMSHSAKIKNSHTDNISGNFYLITRYRKRASMQATFVLEIMILMVCNVQPLLSILTIKKLVQLRDKMKLNEMRQDYWWKIFCQIFFLCVKTHSRVMFSYRGEKLINFNLFVSSFMCVSLRSFCYAISVIKNCLVTFGAMVFLGNALLHFDTWTPKGCDRLRSFKNQNT